MKKYIIPSGVYEILKWAGLIAFPAIAVFVSTVGQAWGIDASLSNAIVATLNAIGVLIGALIGVSQATSRLEEGEGE